MGNSSLYRGLYCLWYIEKHNPLSRHCIHCCRICQNSRSGFARLVILKRHFVWNAVLPRLQSAKKNWYNLKISIVWNWIEILTLTTLKDRLTLENAQQDPQCPWSLIAVTAPCFLQSTCLGNSTLAGEINVAPTDSLRAFTDLLKPFKVLTNSWCSYKRNMHL